MLFNGTVSTYTSLLIDCPIYTFGNPLPTGWTNLALILILLLFAAIALAAAVWLIAAMVKYPKPKLFEQFKFQFSISGKAQHVLRSHHV